MVHFILARTFPWSESHTETSVLGFLCPRLCAGIMTAHGLGNTERLISSTRPAIRQDHRTRAGQGHQAEEVGVIYELKQ